MPIPVTKYASIISAHAAPPYIKSLCVPELAHSMSERLVFLCVGSRIYSGSIRETRVEEGILVNVFQIENRIIGTHVYAGEPSLITVESDVLYDRLSDARDAVNTHRVWNAFHKLVRLVDELFRF